MKVLVTGGTGFVGGAFLTRAAAENRFSLRVSVRSDVHGFPANIEPVLVEGLTETANWRETVKGCDVVVHAAARVHVMQDTSVDPTVEFHRVNVVGTMNLARQAAKSGVKRFVFLSSIKVNGEGTELGRPYAADDVPAPVDPYGISKHDAEAGLRRLAAESGIEIVIIRSPLVYGPGVKGNFQSMMQWVNRGVPLPLGAIHNKRSLVALDNLVDLIITCVEHPAAANQTFLAGDGEDLSTTDLLQRVALALECPARLIPVPVLFLKLGATLLGKRAMSRRLFGSLQVDISKARDLLGWTPPVSVDEGLKKSADWFVLTKNLSRKADDRKV